MNIFGKLANWYFTRDALPYWCVMLLDSFICYFSGILVFWFYYRGAVTLENLDLLSVTILVYMCFNLIGFRVFRTYSGIIRYSTFVDLQRVAYAMALSCCIAELAHYAIFYLDLNFVRLQGRQIFLMYFIATILMWVMRVFVKMLYDVKFSMGNGEQAMIYGVHEGGVALAKMIRNTKPARFCLKGFIMHDTAYAGRVLMGVRIYDPADDFTAVLRKLNVRAVLVSPMQTDRFREDKALQDLLINMGIHIYITKSQEWNRGEDLSVSQLKEIKVEDLLPREEIEVDMDAVSRMLAGKRVMITGSAGSIGSEMVRQVAACRPANMILIDQAETPQHEIRMMMAKRFPNVECETIVVSITQQKRMEHLFAKYRPDVVFHAAAYKHVPMMENNPGEAVCNNIYGTKIIADLSVKYGVGKFVMISTDKAVNPTNVMGCSKRICEIYCQSLDGAVRVGEKTDAEGRPAVTQFVTTRFGNVLGSNGSVIPLFERQIKAGGPVTVTHPDIIRFFMLIPEACKLVLEAGTHGQGGQILVFDMGMPVKIADLAARMIKLSGVQGVEIKYTGLRAGEKLYEEVLSNNENTLPSFHKKIRVAKVREYDYNKVEQQIEHLVATAYTYQDMDVVREMKSIVPEYHPNNTAYSVLDKKTES